MFLFNNLSNSSLAQIKIFFIFSRHVLFNFELQKKTEKIQKKKFKNVIIAVWFD